MQLINRFNAGCMQDAAIQYVHNVRIRMQSSMKQEAHTSPVQKEIQDADMARMRQEANLSTVLKRYRMQIWPA